MANVVDNGKDKYYLDMVMEVLHEEKVFVYDLIPKRMAREKREGR